MSLIKFNNFFYRYKGNEEYALNDINLKISSNKFILLCGETGSGKTSLIRCMNGLIPQFYPGFYKGSVEVMGKNTVNISTSELSREVGIVFQNPENQLIAMNVEHEIAFGMENLGILRDEMVKKIKENIKLCEIEPLLDKAPFELSGGEQQRVAIASVLALEPKLLILDEPTALLDPYIAEKIINLLKKIQTKRDITIIISEHRLDLVLPIVDELILMREGTILEHGTKNKVINGENFHDLPLNHPVIYSIFSKLKQQKIYNHKIPASIPEAVNKLINLMK